MLTRWILWLKIYEFVPTCHLVWLNFWEIWDGMIYYNFKRLSNHVTTSWLLCYIQCQVIIPLYCLDMKTYMVVFLHAVGRCAYWLIARLAKKRSSIKNEDTGSEGSALAIINFVAFFGSLFLLAYCIEASTNRDTITEKYTYGSISYISLSSSNINLSMWL